MTQPPVQPRTAPDVPLRLVHWTHTMPVVEPFRLDFTVSALRRLPSNLVDVFTADGSYIHAIPGRHDPKIVRVRQHAPGELEVAITAGSLDAEDKQRTLHLVGRTLGVDRDLTNFYSSAAAVRWLAPLAQRLRGLKPPRYRTLWEAFVNAVVYQQVSLHAASAVVNRLIEAFGTPLESDGVRLYLFPDANRVLSAPDAALRAEGLSAGKLATLRRAADAMAKGTIGAEAIEALPSEEAAALLRSIKGIGPWTAAVILLRGFGRLDVFPMNDSGVARNLALAAGDSAADIDRVLALLGEQRAMLYFHLLLARLEERGEIGSPSLSVDHARRGHLDS